MARVRMPRLGILRISSRGLDLEDLLLMIHLYALISSGIERRDAIRILSSEDRIYRKTHKTLVFINRIVRGWGYDLVTALVLASKRVKRVFTREFLERLSQVVGSGADIVAFLRNEIDSALVTYVSQMDKVFEAIRVLFSLFSTSMSTSVFLLANMAIMAMLLGGGDQFFIASALGLLISIAVLALIVIIMIPRDPIAFSRSYVERRMRLYTLLSIIVGVSLFMVGLVVYPYQMILPISLLSISLIVFGRLIINLESRLIKYDDAFPVFMRSLGHLLHVVPDMKQSIKAIMRGSLGILEKSVAILKRRLYMGVSLERAWMKMLEEIGSRICLFSGEVMLHTFLSQGDVRGMGKMLGDVMSSINDIRKKRSQMARAFESTLLMLHLLTSSILGLIGVLVSIFSQIASLPGMTVISIAPISGEIVFRVSVIVIAALSMVNGAVSRAIYPGSLVGSIYHIGVLLILGLIAYTITSNALSGLLTGFLGNINIGSIQT